MPASDSRGFYTLRFFLEKRTSNGDVQCTKNVIILRREILLHFIATIINTFTTRLGQFRIWWFLCVIERQWVMWLTGVGGSTQPPYFLWTRRGPEQGCVVITLTHRRGCSPSLLSSHSQYPVNSYWLTSLCYVQSWAKGVSE